MQRCGQDVEKPQRLVLAIVQQVSPPLSNRRGWLPAPETESAGWREPFDRRLAPVVGRLGQ